MSEDPRAAIRKMVAEMPPDQLQATLKSILGGGLRDFVPDPHTPPAPTVREAPAEPSLLTVRVDVDGTKPPVWRRLVLHGDLTLDQVHAVLQAAFGWEGYHLHQFTTLAGRNSYRAPRFLTDFDLTEGEEGVPEAQVRLDQVLRKSGDRLRYTYDFGDDWVHTIRLESVDAMASGAPFAVCVGGRMAGPLEDCGGPWGHNDLVEAFRAGPGLSGLHEDRRDWVPEGWDPTVLDLDEVALRLTMLGGAQGHPLIEEVLAGPGGAGPGEDQALPAGLLPLLEIAPPAVAAEIVEQCARARDVDVVGLTAQGCAQIARPYRYLVELAGEEGIPLTGAGWMKPAYVERVYRELGLDADWIGKGNREDQTAPVARLRAMCQQVGLLRKHKGRLLQTRLARSLTTDEEYVDALATRLLHERDPFVGSAITLFAVLTAASGRALADHAEVIASFMTASGLRTGPDGVGRWDVLEWVRPVWLTLRDTTGRTLRDLDDKPRPGDDRAVALARRALWPGP